MQHLQALEDLFSDKNKASVGGVNLMKKLFFLLYHGNLEINGQLPNKAFFLSDYFVDGFRLMVDWSALSLANQKKLKRWLIVEESASMNARFGDFYRIIETSGRPEEKSLGILDYLSNSWLFKKRYYQWPLPHDLLSPSFELKKTDMVIARSGALFDFIPKYELLDREVSPATKEYYGDSEKQNIKKLILTNDIIDKLDSIADFDFKKNLRQPHPYAIQVNNAKLRRKRMEDVRENKGYDAINPVWSFILRWANLLHRWFFEDNKVINYLFPKDEKIAKKDFKPFLKLDGLNAYLDEESGEVLLFEKRPKIKRFVFCGGGAKVYGHLGAVVELFKEGIIPTEFAGSSAGAIMSLMLYLAYQPEDIIQLFQWFRQDNLMDYSVKIKGISTSDKLKQAVDWAIYNKILKEIKENPDIFATNEGRRFLNEWILPPKKVTFLALEKFKEFCPKSKIGDLLLCTATHVKKQQTHFFSAKENPHFEVSEAIASSASLPVVYHPRGKDDERYIDGGVTNNLPVDYFCQDDNTFINHELRADYSTLAFQFDNGFEGDILYSNNDVFREGYFSNVIYSFLTGINSPADAWMRERRHLRRYATQTVLIELDDVKMSRFDVDDKTCQYSLAKGKEGVKEYLNAHFSYKNGKYQNSEQLHQKFENIEALINHAVRKNRLDVVDAIFEKIKNTDGINQRYKRYLIRKISAIEKPIDREKTKSVKPRKKGSVFYSQDLTKWESKNHNDGIYQIKVFHLLFPILAQDWKLLLNKDKQKTANKKRQNLLIDNIILLRKKLTTSSPEETLHALQKLLANASGETHLMVFLLGEFLQEVTPENIDAVEKKISQLSLHFNSPIWQSEHASADFFADWQKAGNGNDLSDGILNFMKAETEFLNFFKKGLKASLNQKVSLSKTSSSKTAQFAF